jgi:hypothetical protein
MIPVSREYLSPDAVLKALRLVLVVAGLKLCGVY